MSKSIYPQLQLNSYRILVIAPGLDDESEFDRSFSPSFCFLSLSDGKNHMTNNSYAEGPIPANYRIKSISQ